MFADKTNPRVTAVLGPTNTGKTHFAIERMLGYSTGMIGLPLRLLAREIYDRVVAQKGAKSVALITGEEKIVPETARYFVCTVEAMPLDKQVDCLVIDEIQLASHPERGHVFTDRLLHARGIAETIFLGAETMKPVIAGLVREAEIITRPRLSKLTYSGYKKPARLPPRSAIVAFSAAEVYRIAEFIRQHRGGTAVVLGALSPRTRNAQVDLFEKGEVDYLVATDAIGMGLNLDIAHVAFARDTKFDGRNGRRLWPEEVAQIAGRAGRHMRDGTFGTTFELKGFDDALVTTIEEHRFDPVTKLYWRNSTLDFANPRALLHSLEVRPGLRICAQIHDADDHRALKAMAQRLDDDRKILGRDRTRLLWEVCQIPDFRKIMSDDHINLLSQIFDYLGGRNRTLPTDWVVTQIAQLDHSIGTIETLSAGLAAIRTWTYVTAKTGWTANDLHERARSVENRISDALHTALSERFVDRRSASLARATGAGQELLAGVRSNGEVVVEGHVMGRLTGFAFVPDDSVMAGDRALVLKTAQRALAQEIKTRLRDFAALPNSAFALTLYGSIEWQGTSIARLARSAAMLEPAVQIPKNDLIDPAQTAVIVQRLTAWLQGDIRRHLQTLYGLQKAQINDTLDPELRGLAFRLFENNGVIENGLDDFTKQQQQQQWLQSRGVTIGTRYLYMKGLLKPEAIAFLTLLWNVQQRTKLAPPKPNRIMIRIRADDTEFYNAIGYPVVDRYAIRVDRLDDLIGEMQNNADLKPKSVSRRLMCTSLEAQAIIDGVARKKQPKSQTRFLQSPFVTLKSELFSSPQD